MKKWLLTVLLISSLGAGCAPRPVAVRGEVTLDGQPLDEAAIRFSPPAGGSRPVAAMVRQGAYEIAASEGLLPGEYRVEFIDAPPLSGGHETGEPNARRSFPYRYTHESPLTVQVGDEHTSAGFARFDFELTSGK